MSFRKVGSPESTISVHDSATAKTSHFCAGCESMTETSLDKKAFVAGKPAESKCAKCGAPLG